MHFQRIHIELTNRCNFSCMFCPDSLMTRKRGNMDFAILSKILNEISQEKLTKQVLFHIMGEPLLYPDLGKAVNYAKGKGLNVCLTTNGWTMNEELLGKLLSENIDHIIFSVQTPDERSFKLRTEKVDFFTYKKSVSSSIARIIEGGKNTKATLSLLVTPFKSLTLPSKKFDIINTKRDLVRYFTYWMEEILNRMTMRSLAEKICTNMERIQEELFRFHMLGWNKLKITDNFILETRVLGDWVHPGLYTNKIRKAVIGCCEGLTEHFGILWNGDIVFCCVDFNGHTAFDNLNKRTIKEAFQKERVKTVVDGFKRFRVKHPYCQKCLGDTSLKNALVKQIGSIVYFKWYRKRWVAKREREEALIQ